MKNLLNFHKVEKCWRESGQKKSYKETITITVYSNGAVI